MDDLNRARAKGIEKPGGAIGIHGSDPRLAGLARAWIRLANAAGLQKLWGPTDGCIGLTNEDVDVLYLTLDERRPAASASPPARLPALAEALAARLGER
ncbi:L,D-transpeptidase [Sorangium sp. So ce1504]|uniref:hypothetical protein n=1 Tax=Sorangium sp. So ce1504 TaxID=3133337 RepID=UPI003F622819